VSTHELWAATRALADCWSSSPIVVGVRKELKLIVRDLDNPAALPGLLRITRMGSHEFYSRPIHLYKAFPHMEVNLTARERDFSHNSANIERSVSYLTWWIRSRLPGFPTIPAPQLAKDSYHSKFDPEMPWTRDGLSAGLQYSRRPAQCDYFMGVESGSRPDELAQAFMSLPSWLEFAAISQQLDDATRSELLAAKRTLADRAAAAGTESGNDFGDPRVQWGRARAMTSAVVADLSPFAAKFAAAFESVNAEINRALQCVLVQLIAFGPPRRLSGVTDLDVRATDPPTISFQVTSGANTGCLYWTDDSLIKDAVLIESFGFGGSQVHGNRANGSAVVLLGSSTAWSEWLHA